MNNRTSWFVFSLLKEAASIIPFSDKSNFGFGFSQVAKRFKGCFKHRDPGKGKYNPVKRSKGMRFWAPDRWRAHCAQVPKGMR